jgi:hypothetical protein
MLHGLNISAAIYNFQLCDSKDFRTYWLLLNTSYVMEFFLQTLVKKDYLDQDQMLILQQVLMLASTVAAIYVLRSINFYISVLSMLLNFLNRGYDFQNVFLIILLLYFANM